ncbi:DUF2868 domain-containing protein [Spectribacter hydrogenoxidans]|uniref:DUF2868 domain-containing protein n=1 Tax=Spectribacter hydrogenoxidans TaxID=3075608 RepID=A0ABU3C2F0_9GAMM|nr:DUF2868 domain-containing protein [Salinisphaera sp. W335]MDT0635690.1 DUF2868 domain-containing protein [Salinisphaera sp. W335]
MNAAQPNRRIRDAFLALVVGRQEELAGHPQTFSDADSAAAGAGGPFHTRIRVRARRLTEADGRADQIRRATRRLALAAIAGLVLAGLAGLSAASAALASPPPVNLPLVLALLVGVNLASLGLWLLLLPLTVRAGSGFGDHLWGWWRRWRRMPTSGHPPAGLIATRLLMTERPGKWLFSAWVHGLWLIFTLAALLALTVLLSLRETVLVWETTLLNDTTLQRWAELLSLGPALFGVPGPDSLPLQGEAARSARQSWAAWLLVATAVYGALPRLIALVISLGLARISLARASRDEQRPGFARLRSRLMSATATPGITPSGATRAVAMEPASPDAPAAPEGVWQAIGLELEMPPPAPPGAEWHWLGGVDDLNSRQTLLARLPRLHVDRLLLMVGVRTTPDRSVERFLGEALAAAGANGAILLVGQPPTAARRNAWQDLAAAAGADLGVFWLPGSGPERLSA